MARIGIGLIGTGRHGDRYAQHLLRDAPELELVGIARRDAALARQQAAQYGCRAFAHYRDLLAAPEVHAVIIVVPPTLHREMVLAAAAAGKAVLLEKPAAPTVEDGRAMLSAVRDAGIPLMVAQTLRYNGVVSTLKRLLPEIGPIHALRISQRFEPSRPGWIDDPNVAGGGVMLHTGVHSFDLVHHLSGMAVERVVCETASVGTARTEDNFSATLRLEGGAALASVSGSRATASRSGPIEIAGRDGQLIGDHVFNQAFLVRGTVATPVEVPPPVPTVRETLLDFGRALATGAPMPISLLDGLRAVAVARAGYAAAARGGSIAVETFA